MFDAAVLKGKRILVTGGGTGLGKEMSVGFAAHGAHVYICGRRKEVLDQAVRDIAERSGGTVSALLANVRDPDSIEAMMSSIWAEGPLTGLVNNAAANFLAPTESLSPRGYEAVRSTVMDGSFYASLACGKRWIAAGLPGSIISNLVTWVWTGSAYVVPSAMAKAAVHAMTMSLAVEWGPKGIRVNAIAPGPFPTEGAWDKLNPLAETGVGATQAEEVPLRRFGKMDELRNLLIFLMSDGSSYITGDTISIDGGHHLAAPSTFAGLSKLSATDWQRAREAIQASVQKEKQARSI
ncbi:MULTISPECIES: SDR family oxidoreductase [Bradyrhizobium]|uniref:SDR family NAD(P)-dependent oxidoreductase n=1 Tax=Bradyrhizobium arachidis TaxID=858423 RepID=A0AAE7NX08_9BRAD|nr:MULTISPECIES: SDR family oxidoreductase [Bradyrhizobium]QOG21883.1 SDR family oxidoreductase [Bradyrhizobium sp. SEMIA]QOZ70998.1 SDR family NAD(P)-dependent oxidoreductase [Bradyrhizobium arachidis]UFW47442.1 SDR family oxidoreductase [Bradyrhizobium arachidis]SFV17741.1 NAD(P)-dependent dehydrogenase, short-chain alcohol dehydrogenase family [Bradyrhizobium arachidis]